MFFKFFFHLELRHYVIIIYYYSLLFNSYNLRSIARRTTCSKTYSRRTQVIVYCHHTVRRVIIIFRPDDDRCSAFARPLGILDRWLNDASFLRREVEYHKVHYARSQLTFATASLDFLFRNARVTFLILLLLLLFDRSFVCVARRNIIYTRGKIIYIVDKVMRLNKNSIYGKSGGR